MKTIYNYKNSINNYSTNKYNGRNFQNYIERKGNKIVSDFNIQNLTRYKKIKTSVFPSNPFDSINSMNLNNFLHINNKYK